MNYETVKKEHDYVKKMISFYQDRFKSFPPGKIVYTQKSNNNISWYQSDGKHHTYIKKKDSQLILKLISKKYESNLLDELIQEEKILSRYENFLSKKKSDSMLNCNSVYQRYLTHNYHTQQQEITNWKNSPYKQSTEHPETLTIDSLTGHVLRSKSEVFIDMALAQYDIPYRYEDTLIINNTVFHPDFTIKHPKTGKEYIWEHFGKLDDSSYFQNNINYKLKVYIANGWIPGQNLIITGETAESPLSASIIEQIIKTYFLD